jgi:RNA polymerase sigma factor (sigma-70 family)
VARGQLGTVLRHIRQLLGAGSAGDLTDHQLLDRFRPARDADAFTALVQRHGPMVHGVCCRILPDGNDADDAFQATFLVLARKADSIRQGNSVGGWLHGVAARLAARSRADASRRRKHERQAAAMQTEVLGPQALWPEVRPILDEELSRLPEKYRLPVVLRYLQGKSHEETAQELGCPAGTLSWRLAQARELLAKRLARRGVVLSAAVLETLLADKACSAALPPALTTAAVQAGLAFVAGQTCAGSTQAMLLAEGAMKAMIVTKLKAAAVVLLTLGMLCGAWAVLAYRNGGAVNMVLAVPSETETKPEQPGGKAVNDLKLILSADKTETVMKADGSDAEPVNLKASFLNVSDKPIVLDHVHLSILKLTTEVTPPNAEAVRWIEKTYPPTLWGPWQAAATDFTEIKPGNRWSSELPFPSEGRISDGKTKNWSDLKLLKPGDYRVKLTYDHSGKRRYPIESPIVQGFAAASWTGTLVSNELVLRVLPAGSRTSADVKLPDDPEAVVVSIGPNGFEDWNLRLRGNGATRFLISVNERPHHQEIVLPAEAVQDLMCYIVRERQFFEITTTHVDEKGLQSAIEASALKDMSEEAARNRYMPKILRVQAEGRSHAVTYWGLEGLPATPERERLKAILTRLKQIMKNDPASK